MGLEILLISPFPPRLGGSAISNANLVDGLIEYGHRFSVITQINGQRDLEQISDQSWLEKGVPIKRIQVPYKPSNIAPTIGEISAIERGILSQFEEIASQKVPDVVVLGYDSWGWYAPIFNEIGIPTAVTLGGRPTTLLNEGEYNKNFIDDFIRSLDKADLIFPKSNDLKQIVSSHGIDNSKIHIIRNGIDTTVFNPNRKKYGLMEKINIPQYAYVLSHVSNMKPFKRTIDIVDAASHIINEFPETYFLIIGEGPLYKDMINRCEELGIRENFRFVGKIYRDDIALYLNESNAYIMSSEKGEGCPTAVIEALACGLPAIVSDIRPHIELVNNSQNLIYPVGDSKALADRIKYVMVESEQVSQITKELYEHVSSNYTNENRFNQWNNHLNELMLKIRIKNVSMIPELRQNGMNISSQPYKPINLAVRGAI